MLAQHSSKTCEHYTPALIVNAARLAMGSIDTDPCSSELANQLIKAPVWHRENGLGVEWHGNVLCNPPGGQIAIGNRRVSQPCMFWTKAITEYESRRMRACVFIAFTLEMLSRAQNYTAHHPHRFTVCYPKSRIAYDKVINGVRTSSTSPPHSSAIVFIPALDDPYSVERFRMAFSPFGYVR